MRTDRRGHSFGENHSVKTIRGKPFGEGHSGKAMSAVAMPETGWKPMPLPLKILSAIMLLWSVGSVLNLPNLMENGLPFFGRDLYGSGALLVVLMLDIVGPLVFLFGVWRRKPWAPVWAAAYIGIFIINGAVAVFTVGERTGLPQILVPVAVSMAFLAVIFWKRAYFTGAG